MFNDQPVVIIVGPVLTGPFPRTGNLCQSSGDINFNNFFEYRKAIGWVALAIQGGVEVALSDKLSWYNEFGFRYRSGLADKRRELF